MRCWCESACSKASSTDRSALASWKANAPKPADYNILPETLDKSPFAGFTVANDSRWRNALRWITYATFQAEESKISSKTLDASLKSPDPFVQKFLGVPAAERRRRAYQTLRLVELHHRMSALPEELSGGEQQRVALARALVNDPVLLVADEPTGNLDHRLAQEVMKLFVEISLQGTTVLVATHDQELVKASGRRCLTLDGGQVVEGLVEAALPPQASHRREEAR